MFCMRTDPEEDRVFLLFFEEDFFRETFFVEAFRETEVRALGFLFAASHSIGADTANANSMTVVTNFAKTLLTAGFIIRNECI